MEDGIEYFYNSLYVQCSEVLCRTAKAAEEVLTPRHSSIIIGVGPEFALLMRCSEVLFARAGDDFDRKCAKRIRMLLLGHELREAIYGSLSSRPTQYR